MNASSASGRQFGGRRYLTVSDVADYLSLAVETVYLYARTGVIPATKIGKHWRFSMDRLEEWMSHREGIGPGSDKLSVLVVQPDLQVAEAFKTWFAEAGCDVYAVASREQAFPLLGRKPFDLILIDLADLRLGGLETLQKIQELSPRTEIVVAASRIDADIMNRVLDIGPLTVLRKPVSKADVQRLAEAHVVNRERAAGAEGRGQGGDGGAGGAQMASSTAGGQEGAVIFNI